MPSKTPLVYIFCALPCEARPLIRAWKLTRLVQFQSFAVYANAERVVTVTGIGKVAMAGAVGYVMAAFCADSMPVLLNIGIAGHRNQVQGSLWLANKVVDVESGRRFYPQQPFSPPCKTSELVTFTKPNNDYDVEGLYDMEAAAFYEMAVKFSSAELIHCLKVVSDNQDFSLETINEMAVDVWCDAGMDVIESLIHCLQALKQTLPIEAPNQFDEIGQAFHFSATNSSKLKRLLQRWSLVRGGELLNWREAGCRNRNGKEFLLWLESSVNEQAFYL